MKTILAFIALVAAATARADDYMMVLKDFDVLVMIPGSLPMKWTMEKGDCFPLLRIESKQLTQYASDTLCWDSAVLKLDNATFTVLLGSRDIRQPQLTQSADLVRVPTTHVAAATIQYRETVKQYRDEVKEANRAADVAEARSLLEALQRQLIDQRQQIDRLRQQQLQRR